MNQQTPSPATSSSPGISASWLYTLTPRERKVLELSLAELPCKEIGRRLGIAEDTVKKYRKSLARKMGVKGKKAFRAELAKLKF